MRRIAVAALMGSVVAVGPDDAPATEPMHAAATDHVHSAPAPDGVEVSAELAAQLADARFATARYAFNPETAKKHGYFIITRSIPDIQIDHRYGV